MALYEPLKIYDATGRFDLALDRAGYLSRQVVGKRVLHVGCADYPITKERIVGGSLLHDQLRRSAKTLVGIDLSEEGIALLAAHGFQDVHVMDAENLTLDGPFDVIMAADSMEHFSNPGKFLEGAARLLAPGGEMVIAVPSALSYGIFQFILSGVEPTHKDHTFYYSPKSLTQLCSRYGLLPTRLVFTAQARGEYDSRAFIFFRDTLLKATRKISPAFVMHFRREAEVAKDRWIDWR